MIELNVIPVTSQGLPVSNPIITCYVIDKNWRECPMEPRIRNWSNFYSGLADFSSATGTQGPFKVYASVVAAGYAPGYIPMHDWDGKSTLNLSILMSPSFKKPSHSQIINVKANFCNLRDSDDIPIFEDFIDALVVDGNPKAEEWASRLRSAGSTHWTIGLSGDYSENLGWAPRYPIRSIDWSNDINGFAKIINWVQQRGFIPIVKLSLDGHLYEPEGNGVGYFWGIDNLPRVLNILDQYTDSVLWSTGYDGCFPDWTPQETIDMLQLLRNILGSTACLDTEFNGPGTVGYCHMGNGPADWVPNKLGLLDCFSIELKTYPPNPEGLRQTANRMIKGRAGPYYLEPMENIKDINVCMFETIAFQAIRKQASPSDAVNVAQFCQNYGFTSFGNGLP